MPDYTALAATADDCGAAPVVTQSPAPGTVISGAGSSVNVVLTATDASGNADSTAFLFTLLDVTAPTLPAVADKPLRDVILQQPQKVEKPRYRVALFGGADWRTTLVVTSVVAFVTLIIAIPLGGIAVKKRLGDALIERIDAAVSASIRQAMADPDAALPYIRQHAQEMDDTVLQSHIQTFVNDFSIDLPEEGKRAILVLETLAMEAGIL